eukprot:TRINITY_DN7761_c0_g1_i3.p1 TRINITY_DN7761_c0_g1~~TRINITY_DN7761_c0_g1_i3.p1  ORF type:complete len:140 (-),score=22.29 TRINITY_DN7761_c0_g1_i3:6-425(-)
MLQHLKTATIEAGAIAAAHVIAQKLATKALESYHRSQLSKEVRLGAEGNEFELIALCELIEQSAIPGLTQLKDAMDDYTRIFTLYNVLLPGGRKRQVVLVFKGDQQVLASELDIDFSPKSHNHAPVSYTHLTLPTICSV